MSARATATATRRSGLSEVEFAALLNWPAKSILPRLRALGLMDPCTRCSGTGHHSFCRDYGTKCFRCAGSGLQAPKLTRKLASIAAERVESGGLDDYLAAAKARAEARKALPGLITEAEKACQPQWEAYRQHDREDLKAFLEGPVYARQVAVNSLYFGDHDRSYIGPKLLGVLDLKRMAERGEIPLTWAVERLMERIERIREVVSTETAHA